jgi:allantoate deiminase
MRNYEIRSEKIFARINELATITEEPGMVTRRFGSDAFIEASQKVLQWMNAAGLETKIDNIGNVRGLLNSSAENAKTLIIASHIDSVVNAGKFDGPLGVLMGIDLVENIVENKLQLPFNILLIAFSDEEGVRFHTTYLGSKVIAGSFDTVLLNKKDENDITLREVIQKLGGNVQLLQQDALTRDSLLGYFEMHIEQGPVLYEAGIPVAVVTAIAGQKRVELVFTGVAGHAGTVPMNMRQDALCCAAECITSIEEFALAHKTDIVATVGKIDITNSASNVVPGLVRCTLDVRSADEVRLTFACNALQNIISQICEDRHIQFQWNMIQETAPVTCSSAMTESLKQAIKAAGHEVVELVSGAGHDAVPMSAVCPVSMMFIRCFKGISHNPLEDVELKDVTAAIEVADHFIDSFLLNQSS